jgi:hypothetical protein
MDLSLSSLPRSSPISNIPSEVLQTILALAVPEPEEKGYCRHGPRCYRRYAISQLWQLFVFRSVCRRFRAATNELPIWFNGDFELLRSWTGYMEADEPRDHREDRIMKALVADRDLTQALGRKASWTFQSLQCLRTAFEGIPGFRKIADTITLAAFNGCNFRVLEDDDACIPPSFEAAIHLLANCSGLTSLRLEDIGGFDLGAIAISCPSLERISLRHVVGCHGTLKELSKLEFLEFDNEEEDDEDVNLSDFLPTNSPELLTHVSIRYGVESHSVSSLHSLANLTDLWIDDLNDDLCYYLKNANIKLVTFGATVNCRNPIMRCWLDAAKIAEIFAAPCLQGLENLTFRFVFWIRGIFRRSTSACTNAHQGRWTRLRRGYSLFGCLLFVCPRMSHGARVLSTCQNSYRLIGKFYQDAPI